MASREAGLVIIQTILQGMPQIKSGQSIYHSYIASPLLKPEMCQIEY
jgi:hypothetical protein